MEINIPPNTIDNVTELLTAVLGFAEKRHKVLAENISRINIPDFVPKDLPLTEFADIMDAAINEHKHNQRIVLYDTEFIKFGPNGSFEVKPVIDKHAEHVFRDNIDDYLELQFNKLWENLLNHRIAGQLLRQNQDTTAKIGN